MPVDPQEINFSRVKDGRVGEAFTRKLDSKLQNSPADHASIDEHWASFREAVHSTALEHLRPATRKHQDCFNENDEEMKALLSEKHRLLRILQNDPSSVSKKAAFTRMHQTVQ